MEQVIRSTSPIDANLAASLIGEAKSAAFKSRAIGIGVAGLAFSLGAAAMLWAYNQSVDPEMLKAVLANLPPIKVDVTVDGEVKMAKDATVKLEKDPTVKPEHGSVVTVTGTIPAQAQPPTVLPTLKPDENPAIKTSVTVFKRLPHADGEVISGWTFASGNAKSPSEQYCYYFQKTGDGNSTRQEIAKDEAVAVASGVAAAEQAARFLKCQWWQSRAALSEAATQSPKLPVGGRT